MCHAAFLWLCFTEPFIFIDPDQFGKQDTEPGAYQSYHIEGMVTQHIQPLPSNQWLVLPGGEILVVFILPAIFVKVPFDPRPFISHIMDDDGIG